jgi:multicomponent K+:H+ antiporter subunit G
MSATFVGVEALVALLLVASGVLALVAALGVLGLPDFFQRLHPPALANTLGAWCACIASALYFSALEWRAALAPLVINLVLAITAPLGTLLLARAALFRARAAGQDVPGSLATDVDDEREGGPAEPR